MGYSKADPQRLKVLITLREDARLSQERAARLCGLEGGQSRKSFADWENGDVIPEPRRRVDFMHYLWDGLLLRRDPREFVRVWDILVEEWGWQALTDVERRELSSAPWPTEVESRPQPPRPPESLSDLHRHYLRRLFEQTWSGISMSLFRRGLGLRPSLLDIYTPLPVAFAITARLDEQGQWRDWWCGRQEEGRERLAEAEEVELLRGAEMARTPQRLQAGEDGTRLRAWADLNVGEHELLPLVTAAQKQMRTGREGRDSEGRTVSWRADAEHAALVQPHFVLTGDPGSGKSCFLRHLALCWAGELLRRAGDAGTAKTTGAGLQALPGWTKPAYTPIYIELRSLVAQAFAELSRDDGCPPALPGLAELRAYLRSNLVKPPPAGVNIDQFVDEVFDLLRAGRAAILLDGLDEVSQAADERRRAQVQAFVAELASEFAPAPIIVTARPYAYRQGEWGLPGFGRTALVPLDWPRQARLAGRLFAKLSPGDADHQREAFAAALGRIPQDLASNPLLLTLLVAIWFHRSRTDKDDLPSTRGELYRSGLTLLLEDWVREKVGKFSIADDLKLSAEELRLVLQLIACHAQENRTRPDEVAVITEGDIFTAMRRIGQGRVADPFLEHLEQQAGMLLEVVEEAPGALVQTWAKQFRFLHLSFQEHLAACELLYRTGEERPQRWPVPADRRFPDGLVRQMLGAPEIWANVLRLATDELVHKGRKADAWELLSACCEPYRAGPADEKEPQAAGFALQVAEETELLSAAPDRGVGAFRAELLKAAGKALTDVAHLTPEQRVIAGRLLGSGPFPGHDARPGVGIRGDGLPDIDWVMIADADPQTGRREFVYQQNERRTEPTFWMARYPITHAQFQAFLDSGDGFRSATWWRGLAASSEDRAQPGRQRFAYWSHPRENASWYDAIAFCRWLTARGQDAGDRLDLPAPEPGKVWRITLPTEWQWEKAARGHDGRAYPWGGEYESGHANVNETFGSRGPHYLAQTSAVGMYPRGASPYGVMDMSGNVWEWCLNEYEHPERIREEGDAHRVLRGGSWGYCAEFASALYRYRGWDLDRFAYRGFRVVAVPVPLSSGS